MLEMIALPLNLLVRLKVQKLSVKWFFYHFFSNPPPVLSSSFHIIAGSPRYSVKGNSPSFLPAPSHSLLPSAEIIQVEDFPEIAFVS